VTKIKGDLYQVDVTVANSRVTPSVAAVTVQKKLHRADRLSLSGPGVELVAAGQIVDRFRNLTRKIKIQKNALWVENGVPGFGRIELRLMVKGGGEAELVYDSLKGGYKTKAIGLQ
jgi:hypothetical protein